MAKVVQIQRPYTRKPPAGVRPNWSRIGLPVPEFWMPLNEGAGDPSAFVKGARRQADTKTNVSSEWTIQPRGLHYRPATTAVNAALAWDNVITALGTGGDVTSLVSFRTASGFAAGIQYLLSLETYDPGLIAINSGAEIYNWYGSAIDTGDFIAANENHVAASYRHTGTRYIKDALNGGALYSNSAANSSNMAGTEIVLNAENSSASSYSSQEDIFYNWVVVWRQKIPEAVITKMLWDDNYIWKIYSRPLPIFIPAAAPGGGWSGKFNEVDSPLSINESTIEKVNEVA